MSLIHDALLRAEAEKRAPGEVPTPTPLPPEPPPEPPPRKSRRSTWVLVVLAAATAAVWVAKYTVPESASVPPSSVSAEQPIVARIAPARPVRPADYTAPAPEPAETREPAGDLDETAASPVTKPAPSLPQLAQVQPSQEQSEELAADAGLPSIEAPATQPATPPVPPVQVAPPAAPAPTYRLSGIIRGPDGSIAVINDQAVGVGESIGVARVVRIERTSVTLENAGRTIVLRM